MKLFNKNKSTRIREQILSGTITNTNVQQVLLHIFSIMTEDERKLIRKIIKSSNQTHLMYLIISMTLKYVYLPYLDFDNVKISNEANIILHQLLKSNIYDPKLFSNISFSKN